MTARVGAHDAGAGSVWLKTTAEVLLGSLAGVSAAVTAWLGELYVFDDVEPRRERLEQNASLHVRGILGRTYLCRRCTRERITSNVCYGPQESGRAVHADRRTLIQLPTRAVVHNGVAEPSTSTDERAAMPKGGESFAA